MIRSNQTVLKLSVDLDPQNEQGGTAIAEAMRINTTITDLTLGAPGAPWPMDAATRAEVDNTLRINKFLRGVDSDANASSAASMATVSTDAVAPASPTPFASVGLLPLLFLPLPALGGGLSASACSYAMSFALFSGCNVIRCLSSSRRLL